MLFSQNTPEKHEKYWRFFTGKIAGAVVLLAVAGGCMASLAAPVAAQTDPTVTPNPAPQATATAAAAQMAQAKAQQEQAAQAQAQAAQARAQADAAYQQAAQAAAEAQAALAAQQAAEAGVAIGRAQEQITAGREALDVLGRNVEAMRGIIDSQAETITGQAGELVELRSSVKQWQDGYNVLNVKVKQQQDQAVEDGKAGLVKTAIGLVVFIAFMASLFIFVREKWQKQATIVVDSQVVEEDPDA